MPKQLMTVNKMNLIQCRIKYLPLPILYSGFTVVISVVVCQEP